MHRWSSRRVRALRDALADLYPSLTRRLRVADDAALPLERIERSEVPIDGWQSVLDEARKEGDDALDRLLKLARADYPDDARWPSLLTDDGAEASPADDAAWQAKVAQLPSRPAIFLGRDDDLSRLRGMLERAGAPGAPWGVGVRGWPGIGKTALSSEIAHDEQLHRAFPDAVVWVSIGADPNAHELLAGVARLFRDDSVRRLGTVQDAVHAVTRHLANRRVLLVLDDVWKAASVMPLLRARSSGTAVLVTSRQPQVFDDLGLPERDVVLLPALDLQSARTLLARLAPDAVARHAEACDELLERVEFLPLAIHVAGRLLAQESRLGWSVRDLLAELADLELLVRARAPADLTEIETQVTPTVTALLRRSTDALSPDGRRCFAMLAPFAPKPATFDLEQLGAVWAREPRGPVRELVARGLLEPTPGGFQMHALLVAHADVLLAELSR